MERMTVLSVVGAALSLLTAILGLITGWGVSRRRGRDNQMRPYELVVKLPSGDAWVPRETDVEQLRRRSRPANMSEHEWHLLLSAVAARDRRDSKGDVPDWILRLLHGDDADRYRKEWGAHLYELIEAAN
jgi:hypothetical protein